MDLFNNKKKPKEPQITELPAHRHTTGDLGIVYTGPVHDDPSVCIGCKVSFCASCGRCHTPGCYQVRVVCEEAQHKLTSRDRYPEDTPPTRRGWFW